MSNTEIKELKQELEQKRKTITDMLEQLKDNEKLQKEQLKDNEKLQNGYLNIGKENRRLINDLMQIQKSINKTIPKPKQEQQKTIVIEQPKKQSFFKSITMQSVTIKRLLICNPLFLSFGCIAIGLEHNEIALGLLGLFTITWLFLMLYCSVKYLSKKLMGLIA